MSSSTNCPFAIRFAYRPTTGPRNRSPSVAIYLFISECPSTISSHLPSLSGTHSETTRPPKFVTCMVISPACNVYSEICLPLYSCSKAALSSKARLSFCSLHDIVNIIVTMLSTNNPFFIIY